MVNVKAIRPISAGLQPAKVYSRPAGAPLVLGAGGRIGLAQQANLQQFEYSIKQLSNSPFSINNPYLVNKVSPGGDTMYDVMGVVGGTVAVGLKAAYESGLYSFKIPETNMPYF